MCTWQAFCSTLLGFSGRNQVKIEKTAPERAVILFCQVCKYNVYKWNAMKTDKVHLCANTPDTCLLNRSEDLSFQLQIESKLMAPTSYSHIGGGRYAPGCLERIKSGGKNMLSISQNNICLPARAFKTINKIREHTMATVPLLPPSVSFSFFPTYSLPFCSSSFASTMQTFSGLSAPPLLGELQHKTSLCRQTAVAHTHTERHKSTHRSVN